MNIFEGLEKLINEHGSATILRQRLELAKEQYDAEISKLQSERNGLATECDDLRRQLTESNAESERLRKELKKLTPHGSLDEVEVSILKLLAQAESGFTAQHIAQTLGANRTKTEFYLTKMERSHLLSAAHFYTSQASRYYIAHAGREYLVRSGLV